MQALTTKFIPATNTRGSVIRAKSQAAVTTVPWDHGKDVRENHDAAALVLLNKLGWRGIWVGGVLPDDTGFAYVKVESGMDELPARISDRF